MFTSGKNTEEVTRSSSIRRWVFAVLLLFFFLWFPLQIFLGLAQDIDASHSSRIASLGWAAHSLNAKKRKRNRTWRLRLPSRGGNTKGARCKPLLFHWFYSQYLLSKYLSSCTLVQDIYDSKYIIVSLVFIGMLMSSLVKQCLSLKVISMVFIDNSKLSLLYQCILSPSRGKGFP